MVTRTDMHLQIAEVLEQGPMTSRQIATKLIKPEHAVTACLRGMQHRKDVKKLKAAAGSFQFRWELA